MVGFLYNHCRFDEGGVELQFENFPHEGLLLEVWCIKKTYAPLGRILRRMGWKLNSIKRTPSNIVENNFFVRCWTNKLIIVVHT